MKTSENPMPSRNVVKERLARVAKEYRSKGYQVSLSPQSADLPYTPDIIARNDNETVVIEVKSNLSQVSRINRMAQAVQEHPGWRFELIIAKGKPRTPSPQFLLTSKE